MLGTVLGKDNKIDDYYNHAVQLLECPEDTDIKV